MIQKREKKNEHYVKKYIIKGKRTSKGNYKSDEKVLIFIEKASNKFDSKFNDGCVVFDVLRKRIFMVEKDG